MKTDDIEILLVEDNPADSILTMHALEKSRVSARIQLVRDGQEALEFLFCRGPFCQREPSRVPSVVLLDLKLPKADGLSVLRQVKTSPRTKAIPVVVLTTSNEESDLVQSYQLGVNSYIQKPVDFTQFQEIVRQLGDYWLLVNRRSPAGAFPEGVQ